jgi:hypothetical protein
VNTKKWTCKDGSKVRIKDMDDRHLRNTIAFLERRHEAFKLMGPPEFAGDIAMWDAEMGYEELLNSDVEDVFPIYADMVQEMEDRRSVLEGLIK